MRVMSMMTCEGWGHLVLLEIYPLISNIVQINLLFKLTRLQTLPNLKRVRDMRPFSLEFPTTLTKQHSLLS